ncbi:alkaline phosphatase PhoX [Salinigranum rubrum]|nr:alkaline phosphatase PhoX [Salinigranum rubrum]
MVDFSRRNLMASSVAAALGVGVASGAASASETEIDESDTPGAPSVKGELKRFSNTAYGAEVTGPFVFADGGLLYSNQHPAADNIGPFSNPGVGYFSGFHFDLDGDNDDFSELPIPETEEQRRQIRSSEGEYVYLAQAREPIGQSERFGVTQTPDGTDITMDNFAGTQYGAAATNPDCNQFVATNDEGTEGYLYTNWENSPGNVSRIKISQTDDGEWEADPKDAANMANTEALRDLGGTRINCYGDLSPWNTMVSSEENYAHTRVNLTSTVGDIVENGGDGLTGACQFWNRPNPASIPGVVADYADNGDISGSFYPQGAFALSGVEFLAYYLGAEQVDQNGDTNGINPIGDVYPNPYRYGYQLDFRNSDAANAEDVEPIKYYVMGRASWEAPDFQNDLKTVYGCSDGDSKGIYKFVANEEIPGYDDPMDVEGTLYAPKITNDAANVEESGERSSPADVTLEVEWIPLGHASNAECEEWIAEYDDVTQVDYLETHADTDWSEDTEAALKEADLEVIANGNQNYITNEEIIEWATQYEENGWNGVDEELRKVPFLETRAAAKEIGASIEFNKAEGVDSRPGSGPGDYVYFGISEFNDALSDEEGDIRMDRVDGGVVYRGELDANYNVSTLEAVIVGPDFTDAAEVANDALRNIDNVYVMEDGRVLCCEDGFNESRRSYPNDCLYVYQPNTQVYVSSVAVGQGESVQADVMAKHVPDGIAGGEFTVEVADPSVVEITSASYPDAVGLSASPTIEAGATATFKFADTNMAMQPEGTEFKLATVTLSGMGAGSTDIDTSASLDDDNGNAIDVEPRSGVAMTGPASIGAGGAAPQDPDGDGLYEDVNGNGRVDYDDVVTLFNNLENSNVKSNARAFDFNGNEQLDYADLVTLYEEAGVDGDGGSSDDDGDSDDGNGNSGNNGNGNNGNGNDSDSSDN